MVHTYNFSIYDADVGRALEAWGASLFYTIPVNPALQSVIPSQNTINPNKATTTTTKDFIKFKNISLPKT